VDINPAYQANELKHCINKVGVKALVSSEHFRSSRYDIITDIAPELKTSQPGQLKSKSAPSLESVVIMSKESFP
jgi:fatty-acyl-CoA synthase